MIARGRRPAAFVASLWLVFLGLALAGSTAWAAIAENDDKDEAPLLKVVGDFNRDGIADVAEAMAVPGDAGGAHVLTVLLGRRDGGFDRVVSGPSLGLDPKSMVVGDFNSDGNPDLIVGDGDGTLIEFLGDGNGGFTPAGQVARVGSAASITAADFNHDGHLDLAVLDGVSRSITVLLGTGDGGFRVAWGFPLPATGSFSRIVAADFNGDGTADLAITNEDQDTFEVMLGNGNGTFTAAPTLSKVLDPNSHCPT